MSLPMCSSWLTIEYPSDDAVLVVASGGIADERALELWAMVEEALERAVGRLVAVDLRSVTTFDVGSVDELVRLAHAAVRRHVNVCALMLPSSPLYQHLQKWRPIDSLPVFPSLAAALAAHEHGPVGR